MITLGSSYLLTSLRKVGILQFNDLLKITLVSFSTLILLVALELWWSAQGGGQKVTLECTICWLKNGLDEFKATFIRKHFSFSFVSSDSLQSSLHFFFLLFFLFWELTCCLEETIVRNRIIIHYNPDFGSASFWFAWDVITVGKRVPLLLERII